MEHLAKFFLLLKPAPRQHGASNYSAAKWGVKSIFRRLKEKALPSKQFGSNVANSVAVTKGSGCIISIPENGDGLERQVDFLASLHKWKIPQHVTPAEHHSLQGVLCFPTLHKCDMDSLGEVVIPQHSFVDWNFLEYIVVVILMLRFFNCFPLFP